jgi:ubiquitin conjugation factor E4 B
MWLTLFSREPNAALDSLTPYLLLEPGEEKGISPDFLTELEARMEEDESIKPMLRKAVAGLSQQLSTLTMNDNYKPYVHVSQNNSHFCKIMN